MDQTRVVVCALMGALWTSPAFAQAADDNALSVRAGASATSIRLDGLFDEPAWTTAEPIPSLTMIEPTEGTSPTFQTTVRLIVNEAAIFIGVICDDGGPGDLVSFTKQRDGSLRNEDNIKIVLDTFLDGRSGYVFQVNPSGARYEKPPPARRRWMPGSPSVTYRRFATTAVSAGWANGWAEGFRLP